MNENLRLIETKFNQLKAKHHEVDIMVDGILDLKKYQEARTKILWILKQEYYDSGALEDDYASRVIECIDSRNVDSSVTWRRMAYVSHGIASGKRDFWEFPNANICAEDLLRCAIIESNKEIGNSNSPNQVMIEGFVRYKDLICMQINAYTPDVVIICLPDSLKVIVDSLYKQCHETDFVNELDNVIIKGADVAIGKDSGPLFLWTYHPQASKGYSGEGITDYAYTMSVLTAYDYAIKRDP